MAAKVKYQGDYKKITLEKMMEFIEANYPEDKDWFKEIAFQDKNGVTKDEYQHLNAKKRFCERYNPSLIPVKKEKKTKSSMLKEW